MVSGVAGELKKVEVKLKWDPSHWGQPPHHLDIIAATYSADASCGPPAYVVHTESRSPDGTINLTRHSETGLGFGFVEVMVLELDRLAPSYTRVVVGVAIHQRGGRMTFADVTNTEVVITERYTKLVSDTFAGVADCTAATVAEFHRNTAGGWGLRHMLRGSDLDPVSFGREMGQMTRP
ncbi:TerD family protein [Streptomyces xanthochromogenes]|uniref:TerD family protein n=1 Tax=Streptomyces xanthochromogenes TaxID=67384 RepID=UPI003417B179